MADMGHMFFNASSFNQSIDMMGGGSYLKMIFTSDIRF
jgi:hypothetical protein